MVQKLYRVHNKDHIFVATKLLVVLVTAISKMGVKNPVEGQSECKLHVCTGQLHAEIQATLLYI